ncbi:transmembrane anchor protein [Donghicola tyrosinivorans]|uniref:Transmembrane anchor protein n=1 Tax=Donghicola tyrosinivorans TaxID=1652492 RepID=A0A2T0WWZ7_9RHOB|nr:transmembrane anchor protein [Donghicola tyrosinivorans]PRY91209.1 hypothetical protein CLV74_104230 [Donghicola tyrosinivorans]
MGDVKAVEASGKGLIGATLGAAAIGAALVVTFWLPAEYGVDPTGVGYALGLTQMGLVKQGLAAAAEEEAQRDPRITEVLSRLGDIEAKLDALSAGAPLEAVEVLPAEWRDSFTYTLAPGQGFEVKLTMTEGQAAQYAWHTDGAGLTHDTHGEGDGEISYEQGRDVASADGTLTAAFDGLHGWWWSNPTAAPIQLTIQTGGEYDRMLHP